jgi:hypothetical protein
MYSLLVAPGPLVYVTACAGDIAYDDILCLVAFVARLSEPAGAQQETAVKIGLCDKTCGAQVRLVLEKLREISEKKFSLRYTYYIV